MLKSSLPDPLLQSADNFKLTLAHSTLFFFFLIRIKTNSQCRLPIVFFILYAEIVPENAEILIYQSMTQVCKSLMCII